MCSLNTADAPGRKVDPVPPDSFACGKPMVTHPWQM